jgi:mannan endo-1,4-beta-mannosidase
VSGDSISRRALVAGLCGSGVAAGTLSLSVSSMSQTPPPARPETAHVRIDDLARGEPIDPFVYGSNEIGTMDGGDPSIDFDARAGVSIRRLGGNLMTGYNWHNNATNAGKDFQHANGAFLPGVLGVAKERLGEPAVAVDAFLANSRRIGAQSLLTLPLAGYVAADMNGVVAPGETAPSPRFLPVDWSPAHEKGRGVNIPALLAHLVEKHGGARAGGIRGYYLDNEPGLWAENHPRLTKGRTTIKSLIAASLRAAAAIKAADPDALVLGPASWGATGMMSLQDAPDWDEYKSHGSFLAAYLDAFRGESERAGHRLLDSLDVHWYPASRRGNLFRAENPAVSSALLDAPRSLDESGFCEDSWVANALGCSIGAGLHLPLLQSLRAIVAENFPQTRISVSEFNYGGAGLFASGLAVADVLGRFGRSGVSIAAHWGSLDGWIGEAYRLYRMKDASGEMFGATGLPVAGAGGFDLSLFAARSGAGALQLVALNKSARPISFDLALASGRAPVLGDTLGFDEIHAHCGMREQTSEASSGRLRLVAPPLSARRYRLA